MIELNRVYRLVHDLNNNVQYKGKNADGSLIHSVTPGYDIKFCIQRILEELGEAEKHAEEKKTDRSLDVLDKLSALAVPMHDLKKAVIDGDKVELEFFETPVVSEEMELEPCQMMPEDIFKDYCESIKKDVEKMSKDPDYGNGVNS